MNDNDLIRRGDALKALDWGDIYGRNAQDAINAIPAVQPTVKPLVWRDDGTNGHETDHAFGFYEVYPSPEGDMLSRDGVDSGVFPTLEAAKAAAQTDYEARILSALDMQPTVSPDVAALVDAAEKVISSYWYASDGVITGIYELETALARVKGVM